MKEKKTKFWNALEEQAISAYQSGAEFILQMDSNAHLGEKIIPGDPNPLNLNGQLFLDFLERVPYLNLINSSQLCEGVITRNRQTVVGLELSCLDVFVTCDRILPFVRKMKIDENRDHVLTNYNHIKMAGK